MADPFHNWLLLIFCLTVNGVKSNPALGETKRRIVGPEVERAARHEIEARVVPVAGDESGLDRALMQRKAEVRAAILDRVRGAVVPEDDYGKGPDLREEVARGAEVRERSDPYVVRGHWAPPATLPRVANVVLPAH